MSKKNRTIELALFFWNDIRGQETDPFADITFKKRYLAHAKSVISDGADVDILKRALVLMKDDGVMPYSILQPLQWTKRGSKGMSYYEVARGLLLSEDKKPPIYDRAARIEWELRHAEAE